MGKRSELTPWYLLCSVSLPEQETLWSLEPREVNLPRGSRVSQCEVGAVSRARSPGQAYPIPQRVFLEWRAWVVRIDPLLISSEYSEYQILQTSRLCIQYQGLWSFQRLIYILFLTEVRHLEVWLHKTVQTLSSMTVKNQKRALEPAGWPEKGNSHVLRCLPWTVRVACGL